MSPDANAYDRIYTALKARLAAGRYPPGHRLEIQRVADEYRSSATPVREVMARLVGEGLVEPQIGGGFRAARLDGSSLASLYRWNAILLGATFNLIAATSPALFVGQGAQTPAADTPERAAATIASLFLAIAQASENENIVKAVTLVNTRLSFVRLAEPTVLKMVPQETTSILRSSSNNDTAALRRRIAAYHNRRVVHAETLSSVLPRWID